VKDRQKGVIEQKARVLQNEVQESSKKRKQHQQTEKVPGRKVRSGVLGEKGQKCETSLGQGTRGGNSEKALNF
jgi:hypothetical protein